VSLRVAIQTAVAGDEVPASVLEAAFGEIMDGKGSPVEIAALLTALRTRGETVDEIVAAARALRARAVSAPEVDPRTVDTCGTGGDGADTFNISTAAAFVVAGAGVPVAKHGNRAASSQTGSIDVLEALGVRIDLPVEASARILAEVGIAPFFARRAHPAMRFVAPVRKELGFRTLMNCLGPLLNPMGVRHQLIGVYDRSLVERLAEALCALGSDRALVVHGADGLDEVTTTGRTFAALLTEGHVSSFEIDPGAYGIPPTVIGALRGGDADENAAIVRSVLEGERGARRDVVLLNAAAALWVAEAASDIDEGLAQARDSVADGAALGKLEALVTASTAAAEAASG
jgi:anthranilate phosphoribosyltransferase